MTESVQYITDDRYILSASQEYASAIMGPALAGGLVGLMLGGAFIQQYFNYWGGKLYQQDSFRTKCLLHTVILLALAQTSLIFWTGYHYATWQQRDSVTLNSTTTVECLNLTFVAFEGSLVQLYLAQRGTALLGRSRWRLLYWAAVVAGVLGALIGSFLNLYASWYAHRTGVYTWWYSVGSCLYQLSSAFVDCLISITLCLSLWRNMTNFSRQTDSILRALIVLTVQSAAPTAIAAVAGACISLVVDFGHDVWTSIYVNVPWAFYQVMTGLYALSFLAVLNGRETVREAAGPSVGGSYKFDRNVLTTVDGSPSMADLEDGRPGMGRGYSGVSGRRVDPALPGTPVVEVGLSDFLGPDAKRTRPTSGGKEDDY